MKDRVILHAKNVLSGNTVDGELHKLSCKRFLNELEKQGTEDFPFIWAPNKAQKIIDFAETLTISEGYEKKKVHLYEHQCFDFGNLFGWVHKDTGFRRFRRSYISMARQNGKSFGNGILGTYIAGFAGYHEGKLFTAATKRRQAKITWDEVRKFIEVDEDLSYLFRVQEWKNTITALATNCTIEALSKEGGLDEGFRSIFSSLDELHQMKDNSIYSSLYRGTSKLPETLVSMITTRGKDLATFAYEMDKYCVNLLKGAFNADDFFADIYSIDDDDDFFDEQAMMKANPSIRHDPLAWEALLKAAKTAKDMGGKEFSEYVTKSLNYWYRSSDNDYIDVEDFNKCIGIESINGLPCYVGLDLSIGGDLTSLGFDFILPDGKDYFLSHSFMPKGRFQEHLRSDNAPYDVWSDKGLITLTGGNGDFITDYLYIVDYLKQFIEEHKIKVLGIGYDNHNISSLLPYLDDFGVPLMDIKQSARFLNDATTNIRLKTKSQEVIYDAADELLAWGLANATIVTNSFGEMKIDKYDEKSTRRIDPVDAIIDAHAMRLLSKPEVDINEAILSDDWTL